MAYRGKFTPKNPEKYLGDPTNIIYRSLLERSFMKYLDGKPNVIAWASEEIPIPYKSPADGRPHRYFVDFFVKMKSSTGREITSLIEIKPEKQTMPPKKPQRITRRYKTEVVTYAINLAKWDAAQKVCEDNGWQWKILTERDLAPHYAHELKENKERKSNRRGNKK